MVDPELLALLICPESRQPLKLVDKGLLAEVNGRIAKGEVVDASGEQLTEALESALVREDGERIYAIRDEIPVLLIEQAIVWPPKTS